MKTSSDNPALIESIRAEIRTRGPQSFAWFMQNALYHPEHGYYSSGRAAIGRHGDFFTSVSVGPLFGQLLAAQFAEIWDRMGRIDNFVIVEQGAHDGQFARDVLEAMQQRAPDFFSAVRYRIAEPFPIWRDRQQKVLEPFLGKVEWCRELSSPSKISPHLNPLPGGEEDAKRQVRAKPFEPFTGVHFSNELLDAMPIHLPGKLVDLDGDEFVFIDRAVSDGARFNQRALDWIDKVAANLQRGYIIAVDYGHMRDEFEPAIQVRAQHRHLDSPFEQIGQADITAHVDWTSVIERAKKDGLRVAGFTDQHHFLTGLLSSWPEILQAGSLDSTALSGQVRVTDVNGKAQREMQTLLHPEMMGRSFQVLALAKDVDPGPPLSGFKFARPLEQ
ncbi:MAG: SAM-dependent methyltransferase [Verrucomicrobiota bacterium]